MERRPATLVGLGRLDSEVETGLDSPVGRPQAYAKSIDAAAEPEPDAPPEAVRAITFKIAYKKRIVDAILPADTTVGEVQVQVERQLQIASGKQKLLYKGKKLESQMTLSEAGIVNKAKLMLMGKVEDGPALRRTFTAETYDKLLANPGLGEPQRASISAQAQQPATRPMTELDVFLERSESRRKLAAARRELEALQKLNDSETPGLSRTQSEVARLRALALENRTAEELEAVRTEVVALRAELGLAAPAAAAGALERTASQQAEYDLQLALAMSQQDTWDEVAAAAEIAAGAALTRTASQERGMSPPDSREGALVRQRSDVAPDGAPVVPDPDATASSALGKKGTRKKKKKGGYADMMSEAMQKKDLTDQERAAQAKARLEAKLVAPDKIVKGNRGLDRI